MDLSQRTKGFQSIVRKFPIGAISMVAPFNFPLNLAAHKIAPAMAVGCVLCQAEMALAPDLSGPMRSRSESPCPTG